jgi:serine/threonine protein kinase
MKQNQLCHSFALEDLLNDDCELQQREMFEAHVAECELCQSRLSETAAGDEWWTKASQHLSTIEQIEIPDEIRSQLVNSSTFVVPAVTGDINQENQAAGSVFDWRQILDPPTHPEMLGRIDQFEIEAKIGQGGMGIVLKGFDRPLNRAVAIKVLSPLLASNGTSRQRFLREAQAAAAVVHPNVVPIYAVNRSEIRPYIVMQLVAGHSLQSLVQEHGPLDFKEIVRIGIQIADGLAQAHNQGLIHRDIKPGNVLTEHDVSRVMITDFGLARAIDDAGLTQTGWITGTPHYMSPEQARGDTLDCRTDLFSLGGLMYYLATGREPFRAEKPFAVIQKIINDQPASPQEINSEIPVMISDIIEKLLEKNSQDRFQTASEVKLLLERYLSHLQQPLRVAKPQRILTRRRRRFRKLAITGVMLLAVALGSFAWWNPFHNPTNHNADPTTANSSIASRPANEPGTTPVKPKPTLAESRVLTLFAGNAFANELKNANDQIESLEQSLQRASPLDAGSDPTTASWPTLFSSELEQLRSGTAELQHLETENETWKRLLRQQQPVREEKLSPNSK